MLESCTPSEKVPEGINSNAHIDELVQNPQNPILPSDRLKEEVRKELDPLFADFYPTSPCYQRFLENVGFFASRLVRAATMSIEMSSAMNAFGAIAYMAATRGSSEKVPNEIIDSARDLPKTMCLISALSYLSMVELIATPYVDLAILMLISKGHDLHIPPDRKHFYTRHAISLQDLDSPALSLSMKLEFLDEHKVNFFSRWIDRELRNRIAHMQFEIDESGMLIVGKEKKDLMQTMKSFTEYNGAVQEYFAKQIQRIVPPNTSA